MIENWKYGKQTPEQILKGLAAKISVNVDDPRFYKFMDENDDLAFLRNYYITPEVARNVGKENSFIYEEGNEFYLDFAAQALSWQPKRSKELVGELLDDWARNSHLTYTQASINVFNDDKFAEKVCHLVGAHPDEVAIMNTLTVNLNFLLISFYMPTAAKYKIIVEEDSFPTVIYALQSHISQRGYNPNDLVLLKPHEGGNGVQLNTQDILEVIEREGDATALIMLSGVQYLTGQILDMRAITEAAHAKGCMIGFDLAHAIGCIEIQLHDWDVDFAVWDAYKFISCGPGCMGGAFMHEKHKDNDFPKLIGWWGHKAETRFDFSNVLDLTPGINGYRNSAPSTLSMACIAASLEIYEKTTIQALRTRSILLLGYLEDLIKPVVAVHNLEVVTPANFAERASQYTYRVPDLNIDTELASRHVQCLFHHDFMRIAVNPAYIRYEKIFRVVQMIKEVLAISANG
uniref:Kynureninase n=1 Tax=Ciona savignyi TaxID=51511 RepID=H2YJA2_CIOSA